MMRERVLTLGSWIDDRRFGIRDLANSETAKRHYRNFLPKTRTGWLLKADGRRCIVECSMARIGHKELKERTNLDFSAEDLTLERKYTSVWNWATHVGGKLTFNFAAGKIHTIAKPSINGTVGTIVVTGHAPTKKREFVFHSPDLQSVNADYLADGAKCFEVPNTVWETFQYLHCDSKQQPTHPTWAHWFPHYESGEPVPVFWWVDSGAPERVGNFGMAYAFKAGFPLSTHDLLRHSHPGHLTPPAEAPLDLPHLIFGVAAEGDQGRGLKRRAWFGLARSTGNGEGRLQTFNQPAILSSPKPKYLGLYVRQRPAKNTEIPQSGRGVRTEPLAAYASLRLKSGEVAASDSARALDNLARPELAGVKIWPSSAGRDRGISIPDPPRIEPAQLPGPSVKTDLYAVPSDTVFETSLTFHNLRPVELGALLWALSLGNPKAFGHEQGRPSFRHRIGMAKPFGFGEVEISVTDLCLDDADDADPLELLKEFTEHMERVFPKPGCWEASPQVRALRKAATPSENSQADLTYMNVTGREGYVDQRNLGVFLEPFVDEECELNKLPPEETTLSQAPRNASAPEADRASGKPQPNSRRVDLEPLFGARVRVKANARADIQSKEGVIENAPSSEFGDFLVRIDGRSVKLKKSLFEVIAPPDT